MPERTMRTRIRVRPVTVRSRRRVSRPWWRHRALTIVLDLAIAGVMFWIAFTANRDAIGETPFHPDETRWLNRSYFIEDIFDPYGSTWQDYYITRGQPPVGSYVIGLGQLIQGGDLNPNLVWDFFYSNSNWNTIAGAMPSDADLERGRLTSAFMGGLAVALTYFVARRLTNPAGGAVAAFLLAWNGLSIRIGSQALSDQTLLVTLALSFLAAFQLMRRPTWPWAIVLGVTFGIGGATKLTPLLLSLVPAGIGALLLVRWLVYPLSRRDRIVDRVLAIKLIAQPVVAFAAFVLVSPYLWSNPIGRTWNLYQFRIQEMESQGNWLTKAKVTGLVPTFDRISNSINLGGVQQTSWRIMDRLNERFGWSLEMVPGLDLTVGAAAIPFVILIAMKYGLRSPHFLVTCLLGAEAAIIVVGLRSDLYRYYLPLALINFICIGVMAGTVAGWIAAGARALLRRRRPRLRTVPYRNPVILPRRLARMRKPGTRPVVRHARPT